MTASLSVLSVVQTVAVVSLRSPSFLSRQVELWHGVSATFGWQ